MKRLLADVLYDAANKHLATPKMMHRSPLTWSCNAALKAEFGRLPTDENHRITYQGSKSKKFMRELGCKGHPLHGATFKTIPEERQGVRYMWLLIAMHVAEDEGIEI